MRRTILTALPLPLLLSACAFFSPIPDARGPADRAHELDVQCRDLSEATAAPRLAREAIDSVEPLMSRVQSGTNSETRLLGAKLHVKPSSGLTRELLTRELQCHEARVLLGKAAPLTDDPYSAAPAWIDIHVDSEDNGFVVRVESFDFETANAELARAKRYVAPSAP
jgi:hypothetical protein